MALENLSAYIALIELTEHISKCVDENKITVDVFIDLAKAFDTVYHESQLNKLYHYGKRCLPHKWISSYLDNRKQYISISDVESSQQYVS